MTTAGSLSISFDDLFGSSPEDISIDKLEDVINGVMADTFRTSNHDPCELVRVVEQGKIQWLTVEEADALLKNKSDDPKNHLQRALQNAMRNDARSLAQEMRILIALAHGTLERYRKENAIPENEIQRTEPVILRIGRQALFIINQLREIELKIQQVRAKNTILADFEKKVSELLHVQKQGEQDKALELAKEVAMMKTKYVRITRGLSSDTQEAYSLRLEVQNQKKTILSSHRYLAAQREGALQEELQDKRRTIQNLKAVLAKTAEGEKDRYQSALHEHEIGATKSVKELQVVQKEQQVLEQQEKETETIITHVRTNLQKKAADSGQKPIVQPSAPAQEPPPAPPEQPAEEPQAPEKKSARRRMVVIDRRKH
jgi:hypothetical protein